MDGNVLDVFERCLSEFPDDPYASDRSVGILEVLRAHFLIIDYFVSERDGEGIGGIGVKDKNLLHSAVYRQFIAYQGQEKYKTDLEKCATLVYGIVCNHPFYDANKRTAFLVALLFLEKSNRTLAVPQKKLENFLVDIADGKLSAHPRYDKVTRGSDEPEIDYIADVLRRFSRQVDKRHYKITFQQLDAILRQYGYCLADPHHNAINVCEIRIKRRYFIAGAKQEELVKVGQIGFPSWKAQVGRKDISQARKATGLTPAKGVDSQVFFKNQDPIGALIDIHKYPLQRLADR
jgi:death-on-curing family protein